MASTRENRVLRGAALRSGPGNKLIGYAAVFNSVAAIGDFSEVVKPGAFSRAIREGQDVRALFNHDSNAVLGRTKANTLLLKEDDTGLRFECNLPDTQTARDLRQGIERGDISGCSFSFSVQKQRWSEEKDSDGTLFKRELLDVDLFDVGPVTFPAYDATSVSARSIWPDGIPAEVRMRVHRIGNHLTASYRMPPLDDDAWKDRAWQRLIRTGVPFSGLTER